MLAGLPGLESGLMICQYSQAACCNEIQGLSMPSSVSNVTTCAGTEDYNSWGPRSAAKAQRTIELTRYVLAVELVAAAEALERQRPAQSGKKVEEIFEKIRQHVQPLSGDRSMSDDINKIVDLIADGTFDDFIKDDLLHK